MASENIVVKAAQPNSYTFTYAGSTANNIPVVRIRKRKSGQVVETFENTVTFGGGTIVWNIMTSQANTANFPAYYEVVVIGPDDETVVWEGYAFLAVPREPGVVDPGSGGEIDQDQLDTIYSRIGIDVGKTTLEDGQLTAVFDSRWGIRSDGTAYFDEDGVPDSDAAAVVPSENGGLKLIPLARPLGNIDTDFKVVSAPFIRNAAQYIGAFGTSEPDGFVVAPTPNELHLIPIYVPSTNSSLEAFSIRVTKSTPGARVRIGVYSTTDSGADVFNKMYDPSLTTQLDCSTTGIKELNFGSPLNNLPPQIYFGVVVQNVSEGYARPEFAGITGRIVGGGSNDPFNRGVAFVGGGNVDGALPITVGTIGSVPNTIGKAISTLARIRG